MTTTDSIFEEAARRYKAQLLAERLIAEGLTVTGLDSKARMQVCRAVRVPHASARTWRLVTEYITAHHARPVPAANYDPFAKFQH